MIKKIPVYAYIDPGSGSFLFQFLVASILTVLISIRRTVKFFRTLVKKVISREKKRT